MKEKEESKKETKQVPKPKGNKDIPQLYQVLECFHISEKVTDLAEKGQYVFKIFPKANKVEIKKAVENLYKVDVLGVNIIKVPPKKRRLGKVSGFKKGYRKAIVRIKKGQKIDIL